MSTIQLKKEYYIGSCYGGGYDYDTVIVHSFRGMLDMIEDTIGGHVKCKPSIACKDAWDASLQFMMSKKDLYAELLSHTFFGLYKLFCLNLRSLDDKMKDEMVDFMTKARSLIS